MKILVPIKRVVDHAVKVHPKADGSGPDIAHAKMAMNPFDEIALEESLKLKEAGIASEVIVISIGPAGCAETLRMGLALGADRALHIQCEDSLLPLSIARIIARVTQDESPQIVFMGKQAIDDDANQTGQMLAGLLDWPQGTFVSHVRIQEGAQRARVKREVDAGIEHIDIALPAVLTSDLRLNTPRFPSLPNIMKAKQKPLQTIPLSELGVDVYQGQRLVRFFEPSPRTGGRIVHSLEELVQELRQNAGVFT